MKFLITISLLLGSLAVLASDTFISNEVANAPIHFYTKSVWSMTNENKSEIGIYLDSKILIEAADEVLALKAPKTIETNFEAVAYDLEHKATFSKTIIKIVVFEDEDPEGHHTIHQFYDQNGVNIFSLQMEVTSESKKSVKFNTFGFVYPCPQFASFEI